MADVAEIEAEVASTLPLRIAAIFIIMVVSLLGCLFPLLVLDLNGRAKWTTNLPLTPSSRNLSDGERVFQGSHAMHLLKSFSAGIILAVGFCHVLAEANEVLSEHVDFPLAFFVAMMGSISVLALSQVVDGLVSGVEKKGKVPGPKEGDLEASPFKTSQTRVVIDAPDSAPETSPSFRVAEQQYHVQPDRQQLTGGSTDSDSSAGDIALGSMGNNNNDPHALARPLSASSKKPSGLFIEAPPPPMMQSPSSTAPPVTVAAPSSSLPSFVSPRTQTQLKSVLSKAAAQAAVARKEGFGNTPTNHSSHNHQHGAGGHNDAVHVVQAFKQHTLAIA